MLASQSVRGQEPYTGLAWNCSPPAEVHVTISTPLPPVEHTEAVLSHALRSLRDLPEGQRVPLHIIIQPTPSLSWSHFKYVTTLYHVFKAHQDVLETRVKALCLYNPSETLQSLVQWTVQKLQGGRTTRPLRVWGLDMWDGDGDGPTEEVKVWIASAADSTEWGSEGSGVKTPVTPREEESGDELQTTEPQPSKPSMSEAAAADTGAGAGTVPQMPDTDQAIKAMAGVMGVDLESEEAKKGMESVSANVERFKQEQERLRGLFAVEERIAGLFRTEFDIVMEFRRTMLETTGKFDKCAGYLQSTKDASIPAGEISEIQAALATELAPHTNPRVLIKKVQEGDAAAREQLPGKLQDALEDLKMKLITEDAFKAVVGEVYDAWHASETFKNNTVKGHLDSWFITMGGGDKEKFATMYKAIFMHRPERVQELYDSDFLKPMHLKRLWLWVQANKDGQDQFKGASKMREYVLDKLHELAVLTRLYKGLECPVRDQLSRITNPDTDLEDMTAEQMDELTRDYMSVMGFDESVLAAQKDAVPTEERQNLYKRGVRALEGVLGSVLLKRGEPRLIITDTDA